MHSASKGENSIALGNVTGNATDLEALGHLEARGVAPMPPVE